MTLRTMAPADSLPARTPARTYFTVRDTSSRSAVGAAGPARRPAAVIEVSGPLDQSAAAGFLVVMKEFASDGDVVVDLAECVEIDDVGETALVTAIRRIIDKGGTVSITSSDHAVHGVLRANGLGFVLWPTPPHYP
jgi:ABC-type transporter Mla MlaB component